MLRAAPRAYVWLGTGKADHDPGLHAPTYDFNDDMLSVGAEFWCRLSEEFLPNTFVNDGQPFRLPVLSLSPRRCKYPPVR